MKNRNLRSIKIARLGSPRRDPDFEGGGGIGTVYIQPGHLFSNSAGSRIVKQVPRPSSLVTSMAPS